MKISLKRCPFCNGHELNMHRSEITSSVYCRECGCYGPFMESDLAASIAWNEGMDNPGALVRDLRTSNRNEMVKIDVS